jgi:hypothetical protein
MLPKAKYRLIIFSPRYILSQKETEEHNETLHNTKFINEILAPLSELHRAGYVYALLRLPRRQFAINTARKWRAYEIA